MKAVIPFDGTSQKRALRRFLMWSDGALRTRSGRGLTDISNDLGVSRATLDRYLNGETPLRSDQFEAFAEALETDKASLIRACFPALDVAEADLDPGPTLRDLLEAAGLPEDEIKQLLSSMKNTPTTAEQRAKIAAFVAGVLGRRDDTQGNRQKRA